MSGAAIRLGFPERKAYMNKQSGAPNRANDCGALNPESQEKF
jgi:hypothetical protein